VVVAKDSNHHNRCEVDIPMEVIMSKGEIGREALAIRKIIVKKIEHTENFSKTITRNKGIAKKYQKTTLFINQDQSFHHDS